MQHPRAVRLFTLLLVLTATVFSLPRWLHAVPSAQRELDAVWQRVQQSGAYRFSADVTQTNTPQATVVNAGRQSKITSLYLEGQTDIQAESLHLTLWSDGGSALVPESGLEVRVEGDSAQARQGNGAWEEIDNFIGLFAPGGDFTTYLGAATNVARQAPEMRTTPLGAVRFTRYTFDIDGRAHARRML
ncbi:MAG: hypothetical protein KDE53_37265, partial [Caldilineaceae bacterium]|nr:hypothetical protein [Caldilineaceae bacterium]